MKLFALFLVIALVATGCALPQKKGGGAVFTLIVPGRQMGPFVIGMTMDEAKQVAKQYGEVAVDNGGGPDGNGQGFCNNMQGSGVCGYDFAVAGWHGVPRTPGSLYLIGSDDKRFRTAEGLGVGSTAAEFIAAYGDPENVVPLTNGYFVEWLTKGIFIVVAKEPKAPVTLVAVFVPQPLAKP